MAWIPFVSFFLMSSFFPHSEGCTNGRVSFEIITGYAYTTSSDLLLMLPGVLELTQCLSYCNRNETCNAVNFESGLCVLLSSNADERPDSLKPSQYPLFTIYAQKICLSSFATRRCNKAWIYEKVIGYKLRSKPRRVTVSRSRQHCMENCLKEQDFNCRSVNFNPVTGDCEEMDADRHSLIYKSTSDLDSLLQASPSVDYMENNCIEDSRKMCEFKKISGSILKTVDSIYPNISDVSTCKQKCLDSPYRCHSFDLGDGEHTVCRTSHLSRASTYHIQEPYLTVAKASTYELDSCYNVTLVCGAREMKVKVGMSKPFNGKIYAMTKPNSCFTRVNNEYDFEFEMPYNDVNCGTVEPGRGLFRNSIVIQHHNLIVTGNDIGLSVNCQYDLSNRQVTHKVHMMEMGENMNEFISDQNRPPIQEATVTSPTVSMKVTDRDGNDIIAAEVGDQLSLRFEVPDDTSPYEIFVREIIADDGVDNAEYMLIDRNGCPTDATIMGPVRKVSPDKKTIEAPFEAFKFPTSGIVQFRALVVPCLPSCEPVRCSTFDYDGHEKKVSSFGRRKRSINYTSNLTEDEMIVVKTIEITDKFPFPTKDRIGPLLQNQLLKESSSCVSINYVAWICGSFCILQFLVIIGWTYLRHKRGNFNRNSLSVLNISTMLPRSKHGPLPGFRSHRSMYNADVILI